MNATDNLYKPPEANLNESVKTGESYTNRFSRDMWIAVAILSLLFILPSFVIGFWEPETVNITRDIVSNLFVVTQLVLTIYFIRRFRVKSLGTIDEVVPEALGIWGYCWRGGVAVFSSLIIIMIPVIIIAILTGFAITDRFSEIAAITIYGVISYPALIIVTWLLFSKDRSNQIRWLAQLFRGY